MDTIKIRDILAAWAASKPLVRRLFIFGSRARGDYRPDSDIDIAIELYLSAAQGADESGGLATWMCNTNGWKEELQTLLPFEIDLEQFRGCDTPTIQQGLQRSHILVYAKAN